jgi:DNA-binding NarL/FixJ family response regulator
MVDGLSDDELARNLGGLVHLATAEMYLDLFEHSGRHAGRALEVGRATGQGDLFPLIFPMLGTSLWVQGRMAESAEVFDGAIEAARLLDNGQVLAWNLFNRSFGAIAAGDVDLALATSRESVEIAKDFDESVLTGHAAWALAAALLETGRAEEALELLLASTGGEELTVIPGGWRANGLWLLTRCLLEAGRREDAERAAAAAIACADAIGLPMSAAMARLAEATLDLDAGDGSRAAELALDAAAALEEVGDAYHAALARMLAGRAFAQAGERERAVGELERAAAAFASFGADRYRAEAEQELRKLGRTIHRRTAAGTADSGLASLTERELELARLVVDRKTNPQIAAELFLSQKTVETHLRNIFRKVGVANRVELARAVEDADRVARAQTLT